jgi:hypothetical protein
MNQNFAKMTVFITELIILKVIAINFEFLKKLANLPQLS